MPHLVRQLMSAITTDLGSVKRLQRPKQQHMLHQIKGLLERVNWLCFQRFPQMDGDFPEDRNLTISSAPPPSRLLLSVTHITTLFTNLETISLHQTRGTSPWVPLEADRLNLRGVWLLTVL